MATPSLRRFLAPALTGAFCAISVPVTPASAQVRAELVSEGATVVPGGTFRVGAWLELEPEWHVYWRYPGDAGLSTEVTWAKESTFAPGPWQFPVPEVFGQPGNLVGYGYADSVLLIAEVTAPSEPGIYELSATIEWLMCREKCIPGKVTDAVTITVADGAAGPTASPRFDHWQSRKPAAVDHPRPFALNLQSNAIDDDKRKITLAATWAHEMPPGVAWIPNPPDAIFIENITHTTDHRSAIIRFEWSTWDDDAPTALESLITWLDPDGVRRGHTISFPLTQTGEAP